MEQLTFGEQVKIILGRKGMTIKELAEIIEERTGKKMSRQNLTQRLGRDNFQEQDMRMIVGILGCTLQLSILPGDEERVELKRLQKAEGHQRACAAEGAEKKVEVDMTIGELYEIHEELSELEEKADTPKESVEKHSESVIEPVAETSKSSKKEKFLTGGIFLRKKDEADTNESKPEVKEAQQENVLHEAAPVNIVPEPDSDDFEPVIRHDDTEENRDVGDVNPYTRREYQTNSVRMHPNRIGYVQVYDRTTHKWTDMTEWAFLGYQERKKALLGKDYEPPIYLD